MGPPMSDDQGGAALLRGSGLTVGLAESCTGGLIAARITAEAGSSAYFKGAIVAYSNQVKEQLLQVPANMLARCGAVSDEVACAMAAGARQALCCDIALAVTGIAGPDGGTPEKPVGTVYIALADADRCQVQGHLFQGDRAAVRQATLEVALEWLKQHLKSAQKA